MNVNQFEFKFGNQSIKIRNASNFYDEYIYWGELGKGSFGTVIKLENRKDKGQFYACKTIRKMNLNAKGIKKILIEGNLINHVVKNINETLTNTLISRYLPTYYETMIFNYKAYTCFGIKMSYLEGHNLLQYLDDPTSNLGPQELDSICLDIVEIVYLLHNKLAIVHRDIKPDNFIYNPIDKSVKITDFGMAGYIGKDNVDKIFQPDLSDSSGTPLYIAPEIFTKKVFTINELKKSDIWSLGLVIYYVYCGNNMLGANSKTLGQFKKVINEYIESSGHIDFNQYPSSAVPQFMDQIIKNCCRPIPRDRWDITKVRQNITQIL